jgi:DNA-binding NtrC family response regulator
VCNRVKYPSFPPPPSRDPTLDHDAAPHESGVVIAVGDVAVGQLVYEALESVSSRVILVSSATEALREMDAMRPGLLVVDDELPLVRGLDLAGKVRSERWDVDVILLTEDQTIASIVARLRVERIRCVPKPLDLERLRQAVSMSLRTLGQRRPGTAYDDLVAELEDQKSRFERRIKNLERKQSSHPPPPDRSAPPAASAPNTPPAAGQPAAVKQDAALPDDLHVLVVDDDPLVRRALARRLSKQQVTFAENGVAATRELERSRPDVIVSDLRMPEMDGLALAEEVKRRWPELADRIVFVSGTGSQILRAEVEAPSQPVLRKPVEGAVLENRIAEVLEKAMLPRKP